MAVEESQAAVAEENQAAADIKEITEILGRDINQMVAEVIQTKEAAAEVAELEVVG